MSEYAYFYNSENGDRVYDADSFSNWLKKFFTTGVFEGDCQVTALGNMVVNLAPGYANIMGKVKELENQTFTLEPADGSYPRIDTIVIERNDTDRDITAKLVTGELSGNDPVPTARVWENGVYQLVVAEIYVAAGATEVTQANITDKRSDPDVCGIVAGTVTEMDFSQFTAQFEAYFAEFEASNLEEFDEWFQHMKDQLDTDAAGHLQNEIDDLTGVVTGIGNRVTTIEGNLSGFKFYPIGTSIVGLIADDSAYTDEDGNYVIWGTATANQLVEDNPNTYKSVPSEEDTRGKEGEDTAKKFGEVSQMIKKAIILTPIYNGAGPQTDILITTYGMGMIAYFEKDGYYSSSPYVTDYFEIRPQNSRNNIPIIFKKGKWIDGEGVVYDTSNGNINVNMLVDSSYRPQRRYNMFALVDE